MIEKRANPWVLGARKALGKFLPGALGAASAAGRAAAGKLSPGLRAAAPGIKSEILEQARFGAGLGGLVGGGLGAVGAEEGHRGEGFLRGAASGALGGAASGVASGAVTGAGRAARGALINRVAPSNLGMLNPADLAKHHQSKSWLGNVRGAFKEDPAGLGRKADLIEAIGAPLTLAGDIAAGGAVMSALPPWAGGSPAAEPQVPKQAADEGSSGFSLSPATLVAPLGGLAGRVGAEELLERKLDPLIAEGGDWARRFPPKGHLRKRILPGLASLGAGATTYGLAQALAPKPAVPEGLEDVDLDLLKAVFAKQPEAPVAATPNTNPRV